MIIKLKKEQKIKVTKAKNIFPIMKDILEFSKKRTCHKELKRFFEKGIVSIVPF